jgi:hypothetical protein
MNILLKQSKWNNFYTFMFFFLRLYETRRKFIFLKIIFASGFQVLFQARL